MTFRRRRPAARPPREPRLPAGDGRPDWTPRGILTVFAACTLLAQLIVAGPIAAGRPASSRSRQRRQRRRPPPSRPTAGDSGELLPGIHYEDAVAHANDRIEFTPGGRVTVGFRPRADDTWDVGGRAPRALPGRFGIGPRPAAVPDADLVPRPRRTPPSQPGLRSIVGRRPAPTAPVDSPAVDPSEVPAADGASAALPAPRTAPSSLDGTRLRREVMGFLPYWEVNDAVLDYEVLSTIAYFSVGADRNGNLLKANADGTPTTGWRGWTSSRLTSIINAAHAKGTRVVLTISVFAWTSGQAALQGALLGSPTARLEPRTAGGGRGPCQGRGRHQPRLRADRVRLRRRVRALRADSPRRARQAGRRLPADVRHDRTTSATTRSRRRPHPAARTRSSSWATTTGRPAPATPARSTRCPGPAYDLQDTVNAFAARVAPLEADPRRALVRPRLVDGLRQGQREDPDRDEVRGVEYRHLRHRDRLRQRSTAAAGTAASSRPGSPTGARTAPRRTAA